MKRIWKYQIPIEYVQDVALPEGAEILTVQFQNAFCLCLWAMVDPEKRLQQRKIEILGTGNPVEESNRRYITTVQDMGGVLVWHVFERV